MAGSDMEEYKLQEESNVQQEYDTHDLVTPKETIIEKIKSWRGRRLLIPVALIAAIILVYQFLSWYSNRKGQSSIRQEEMVAKKQAQSMISPPESMNYQQQAENDAMKKEAFPGAIGSNAISSALQQKLDVLVLKTDGNAEQLQKVQNNVIQTQTTLVSLNQTVDTLSKSVQELSGNLQNAVTSANKSKTKKVGRKRIAAPAAPRAIYHVRAIVPGLAWLESSSGEIVAIRQGDELSGYGKVSLISPKQGMVVTANGTIIQYGVNDF